MIRYEVSESHYVARRERLDDALIFRGKDMAILKGLHEGVDVINLVYLGAR